MATAFVLAAGFGTRLRPLTSSRPKALVPMCGEPLLAYAVAHCRAHGHTDIVINAHHLADQIHAWVRTQGDRGLTVSDEADILGTGGGLKRAETLLDEQVVVVNADVVHDVDLTALRDELPPDGAVLALRPTDDPDRYGVVAADTTHTVVELRDIATTPPRGPVDRTTHFTGIHAFDRSVLAGIPPGFACIVRTAYKDLVPQRKLGAYRHEGLWLDVGDPDAYLHANLHILEAPALSLDPFRGARYARNAHRRLGSSKGLDHANLSGSLWIGSGSSIGSARIHRSIVGENATVPDDTSLVDCVVWDGVRVPPGSFIRTIFHDGGITPID